jgi:hypothetical protein
MHFNFIERGLANPRLDFKREIRISWFRAEEYDVMDVTTSIAMEGYLNGN